MSIEVEPGLAHDADGTIAEAKRLWAKVDRPNVMIKIPATVEGLTAITETIAAGIWVNVTLIFSLERHRQVIDAYLDGSRAGARLRAIDLSKIHSVASFFVSRVDTEIDKRLDAIGTEEALALKSKAGVANARLAYEVFEQAFDVGARAGAARRRRQRAAPAVGIDRRQGPEPSRHALRHRARGRRTSSTPCPRRRSRPPSTTASSTATTSPAATRPRNAVLDALAERASPTTR